MTETIHLSEQGYKYGLTVGQILLHATEKQALVDDLSLQLERASPRGKKAGPDPLRTELRTQKNKLAFRAADVDDLVHAKIGLKAISLTEATILGEGILSKVDIRSGTLKLKQADRQLTEIEYASVMPVPERLDQTYYGHELSVAFEVTSLLSDKLWVLAL